MRRVRGGLAVLLLVTCVAGCARRQTVAEATGATAPAAPTASAAAAPAPAPAASAGLPATAAASPPAAATPHGETPAAASGAAHHAGPPVVVFLGDSLTAGLGLAADQAFPQLVADALAAQGTPIRALNAGVSGDTSAGGLRRLEWVLRQEPDMVVVELGANDGLRGQPVAGIEANLRAVVTRARAAGARVLLLGMRVPPSLGDGYAREFAAVYPRVARDLDVPLVPFLLDGVAGRPELNQPDGIHPNAEGEKIVARNVLPAVAAVLRAPTPAAVAR